MKILRLLFCGVLMLIVLLSARQQSENIATENFDDYAVGPLPDKAPWSIFPGIRGEKRPRAEVVAAKGVGGSQALALWHTESFRSDGIGLHYQLPQPLREGVVWIQVRVKAAPNWHANFYLDARAGRGIVARVTGGPYKDKKIRNVKQRWHVTWRPGARLYQTTAAPKVAWHKITMRLDFTRGSYAAWKDDLVLGEDLPFNAAPPVTQLYISAGGTKESPALIDDLIISKQAPGNMKLAALLPAKKKNHRFRFAVVGDPQLGFGNYKDDLFKFDYAVKQINESGADLTVIPGDLVHKNNDEKSYVDFRKIAERLKKPWYPTRGNHETVDLYKKVIQKPLDYAVNHKGFRFVMLDAIGNHAGLSKDQLAFAAKEMQAAARHNEEIVAAMHVSPWEKNSRGKGKYNQIGKGRDELRKLFSKHKVLLSLSGHYHQGTWRAKEEQTNYLVLGGTARVRGGCVGWCLFDVYPDRIEMYKRPLWFAYERANAKTFYDSGALNRRTFAEAHKSTPWLVQGPLAMQRHWSEKN